MEHGKSMRKFGRETKQRGALLRSLVVTLLEQGRIATTEAKAKSLRPYIEKLITGAKTANLAAIRRLTAELNSAAARRLTKEWAPKLASRRGGYTRIRKLAPRRSDGAKLAIIELVQN